MTGERKATGPDSGNAEANADAPKLSESLHPKLTAHRTKALQVLLADDAHVALASVVHVLAQQVVIEHAYRAESALAIRAGDCEGPLNQVADDMPGSKAASAMQDRLDIWRERLPGEPGKLLAWLIGQDDNTLMELLALCAAMSLDAVTAAPRVHPADDIAAAVRLDMADWWSATATSYLAQVPKARIVDSVSEAVSAEAGAGADQAEKGRGGSQSQSAAHRHALAAVPVALPLKAIPRASSSGRVFALEA